MDCKQFFAAIIKSISWPIVVVLLVLLMSDQIDRLLGNAHKFRYGNLEVSFSEQIDQLKKAVVSAVPVSQGDQSKRAQFAIMASLSPSAAVTKSWDEVISATSLLMLKHIPELVLDKDTPYKHLENLLIECDIADGKQVKIFHDLRILRNKMVHAPEYGITSIQAVEFANLALSLAEHLSTL